MSDTVNDKISWNKFVSGIGTPKSFVKIASYGINILLIILLLSGGLFIWDKFSPKKPAPITQTQTGELTIEAGANVAHIDFNTQQATAPKKTVGLEATVSSTDAGIGFVKYINDNWAVVIGGRWSYDREDDENAVVPEIKIRYDFY